MLKFITSAVVASSFALAAPQNASACGGGSGCGGLRGLCGGKKTCATAPASCEAQPATAPAAPETMPDMPDMAPPAPTTAQNSRAYRSYSYDSAPVYRAPAVRSYANPNSWQQNQFRADRKMRGL